MDNTCADKTARIETLEEVIFGNPDKKEIGMKVKVDEIHTLLVQAKGIPTYLKFILLIGACITVVKGWFN